jgi:hypothetical protein
MKTELFCEGCGKDICNDKNIIQVRQGYTQNGEFFAEGDLCYLCDHCYRNENLNEIIP